MKNMLRFNQLNEVEIHLLKELEPIELFHAEENSERDFVLNDIFSYWSFAKVIKKVDEGFLLNSPRYFFIVQGDLKEGDIIIQDNTNYFKIDFNGINWKDYKKEFEEIQGYKRTYLNEIKQEIINKEWFDNYLTELKVRDEIRKKEREEAEKINKLRESDSESIWKKEGKFDNSNTKYENNLITYKDKEYVLDKPANQVFTYIEVLNLYSIQDELINKNINFTLNKVDNSGNKNQLYRLDFGDKTLFNGINVSKNKLNLLINKLKPEDYNDEFKIKMISKLNGMKLDFISCENIEFRRDDKELKIPITINLIDEENFDVSFFGKQKNMTWGEIKNFFFINSRRLGNYFNFEKLENFSKEFGLTKTEVFGNLKKVIMVSNLENGK